MYASYTKMHIVSEGDTLWGIAEKYNVTLTDLKRMNSISDNQYLQCVKQFYRQDFLHGAMIVMPLMHCQYAYSQMG